jgi:hypothetical protein
MREFDGLLDDTWRRQIGVLQEALALHRDFARSCAIDFDAVRVGGAPVVEAIASFKESSKAFAESIAKLRLDSIAAGFNPDSPRTKSNDFARLLPVGLMESITLEPSPEIMAREISELQQRVADLEAAITLPDPSPMNSDTDGDSKSHTGQYL